MSDTTPETGLTSRRTVLAGVAGVGAAAALVACGNDNTGDTGGNAPTGGATPTGNTGTGTNPGGTNTDAKPLAKTSDIPSGGGKVFEQAKVVVTQPAAGTFKAFTAVCTHMGCTVATVSDGTINCPCHGSKYSITDGSVKDGPAARPLAEKTLKVDGENLILG